MNKTHRIVWSAVRQAYVVTHEHATACGKPASTRAAAVFAAAAIFSGAALASAPSAVDLDSFFNGTGITTQDGAAKGGCMLGVSGAACNAAPKTENVTYTNYHTKGGDGSGGGAGLGGALFVDKGQAITLSNVQFTGNVVEGGTGGGAPDVRVQSANITLVQRQANVVAFSAFNTIPKVESDGKSIQTINLGDNATPLKVGQEVTLDGSSGTAKVASVSADGKTVTLDKALTLSDKAIKTVSGSLTIANDGANAKITGAALTNLGVGGRIEMGAIVSGVAGIPDGTMVTDVKRDSDNKITEVILSKPVSGTLNPADLKFISTPKLNSAQFVVDGTDRKTITLAAASLGLSVGMALKGEGIPDGTVVTAIDSKTGKVTLSKEMPDGVLSFSSKAEIGKQGANTITLAAPDGRIQVGGVITGNGIPDGTTVTGYDKTTGQVTLSKPLTADLADKSSIVTSAVKAQTTNSITLGEVKNLKVGMTVSGEGIPDGAKITSIVGNIVTFDKTLTNPVQGFVATSPLNTGGSLNGLQATGPTGTDGKSGNNANSVLPYLTDGEGLAGFSGQNANKTPPSNGVGGRGGDGGDGSQGVAFNYTLIKDTATASVDFINAVAEAGAAFSNVPFPSFATGSVKIAQSVVAGIELATQITNAAEWVKGLNDGTRAKGGDGGEGGSGGSGSEFFGGGSGGGGGNGGAGGLSKTEGGAGGAGGGGGAGGFGAGGGSGGAGGAGGSTGFAKEGDAGEGGSAGFGAGVGSSGDSSGGGGGSGYGGAIFVREGGSLTITGNALFRDNYAVAGSSTNGGEAGQATGADIFVMKGGSVTLSPGQGNTIRLEGGIADDSAGSIDGAAYASGRGADVRIDGGGLVQFAGTNTYTGKTIIAGGTLETTLGDGIHSDSNIVFNGAGTSQPNLSAGVLLLSENVTKKVGTIVPGQISWDGAGGFASGTTEGIQLNFGRTANSADKGQTLQWGSDALKSNSTLVFGSEYGLGSVEWMNAINLNGQTGKVVVFDSQQLVAGKKVDDVAYMRGTLSNGKLEVGDAGYTGTLYLTGQNSLTELTVHEGKVLTGDGRTTGRLFAESAPGKVSVKDGGSLLLAGAEKVSTLAVDKGGALGTLKGAALTATDVNNQGALMLGDKATLTSLNNAADALLSNMDTVTVSGALVNNGTLLQGQMLSGAGALVSDNANISAKTVTNNKDWVVVGTQQIKADTLDGNGKFVLENLTSGGATKQAVLTLDQSGNSTFAGTFSGDGALDKTGAGTLTLTGASTATGGLTVKAGTVDTTGGGTLADSGAVTIEKDGTFIAGTADTVGAVSNSGKYEVNAAQTVASLSNTGTGVSTLKADLTSTSTVSNAKDGTIVQQADITAAGKVSNDGTLNISGDRTITTAGLEGAASGRVNVADKLTLAQSGNSTYAGQINGAGAMDKTGVGKLTLTGANEFTGGLTVKAGSVDTTGGGTLADSGAITIEQDAGFIAGTADTVGVVSNSGSYSVNAAQTVASLSNTGTGVSTLAANLVSNDTVTNAAGGKIVQQANITATNTVSNDGLIEVTGNRITTSGGYQGSGETNLAEAAKLTIAQDKDSLYSGAFTGKGALDKTGAGKLTLTGASTATGGLTVKQGTVDTTGGGTLADTGAITIEKDGTFIAGTADTVGAVSNSGTYEVNAAQTVASLANTATGVSTLNAKLTSTSTVSNAVGGTINQQADITATGKVSNDGTLNISGERTITTAGLEGAASGRVNVDSKLTLIQSGDSTYAGQINGAGALDKTGAGKLTLTGANSFKGGLTVKAGAIDTTGGGTLFDTGTITIEQGASFIAGTADTVGAVKSSGSYQVSATQTVASLINTGTGVSTLLADLISNSAVENQAGGTLKQQANITATGKVSNDGLIEVTGKQTTSSGGYQGSGETRLAEAAKLTIAQDKDSLYSGVFTGKGALDKTGTGKLTLTSASTATGGLTVKQGTVDTTGGGTLADTGAVTIEKDGTFVAGTADTVGVVTNSGNYTVNAAQTVASLNNTGTATLNVNLSATGKVSNDGTLDIIGDRTISTAGLAGAATGVVKVDSILTLAQSGDSAYAGKIAGGTVQKTGDGTLTLNGTAGSFDAKTLIIDQGVVALEGAFQLAERVGVTVNSSADKVGTLSLVQGNQRITNLSGAGNVALGNNRLTVLGKSAFTGKVSGTGVLDIREGAFEVKDSLTSSDPNSVFNVGSATGNGNTASSAVVTVSKDSTLAFPTVDLQSGSTLAVKENGTVQAGNINLGEQTLLEVATTGQVNTGTGGKLTLNGDKAHLLVQQGASVISPTVTVSAVGSRLDVVGNLQASNLNISTSAQKREDAAVLHLGQVGGGVAGAVNAGQTTVSGGVVSGAGKLSGSLSMGKNSWLSPGNSPGKLSLGNLNLQGGSVAEMEVGASGVDARVAGGNYDQIVVEGNLSISGDAQLQLKSYQGGALAAGEALQLFAVQPGKVSGQFGSVLNAGIGNALFSLGTGSVVGLGAGGYAGFAKQVIRDDNQRQILQGLMVSEAGGVQQFYGGKLVQRLAAASAAGADTDAIFDRFSPETYASLLDQAKSSALYAAPDVYDDLQKDARGVSASYFSRQQETGDDAGYQSYDLNSSGLRIGYVDQFGGDVTWRGNFTVERNKVGSQYFNADGDGLAAGLQLAKPVFADGNGYLTGRVGFGAQNNDVTRQTNDGKAEVNNLNSSAWLLGLGVAHVGKVADLRLQSAAEVIGYQAKVDALKEQNAASPSDALSVDAQKQSGAAVQLSASLSGAVTEKLDLSFGGRLTHFDKEGYDLSAQLNTEQQGFSVRAKGLDATQFSLDAGLNYKVTPFDHITAKVQAFDQGGYQANLTYSRLF